MTHCNWYMKDFKLFTFYKCLLLLYIAPATILSHLSDTIGNETFSTSFTCSVTGIPEPTIKWFRDDSKGIANIVTNTDKYTITTTSVIGQFGLITVTSNLIISNLTKLDELTYSCLGVNNVENVIEANDLSAASLTVQGIIMNWY